MFTLRNLVLCAVIFFGGIQFVQAGKEPELKQMLPRTGVAFATNNSALTYDAVLLQPSGTPTGISYWMDPVGSIKTWSTNSFNNYTIDTLIRNT